MCLRMPFLMKNEVFMGTLSAFYHYFAKTERLLWGCSVTLILLTSTLSVTTSFAAVYLTFRRSPHYAVAYAMNDVVLILLWLLAARTQPRYLSVAVCFCAFLVNDLYGFLCWRAMEKRQRSAR